MPHSESSNRVVIEQFVKTNGGAITREQCQELAKQLGCRTINWAFGTRSPLLKRLPNGIRVLA